MSFFVLKHGMKTRHLAITFIFLCTLDSFLFRFVLVTLENSDPNFNHSINLRTEENEEWFYFQHVENEMLIGKPVAFTKAFHAPWDWGTMDVYGLEEPVPDGVPFGPGLHAICDINGNALNQNDVQSGMTVKIKAKETNWAGWEYMYETPVGWICYDKLRNRIDDDDSDNLKQEWVVEKDGDTIRFENKYYPGEYLMGNLEYLYLEYTRCKKEDCKYFDIYWMYVEKDNPNWWKLIPANN